MAWDAGGQRRMRRFELVSFRYRTLAMRGESHVARVRDEEHDAREQRGPEQGPGHVHEDRLAPRVDAPSHEFHVPSPPRIARVTRFRIGGILCPSSVRVLHAASTTAVAMNAAARSG